VRRIDRLGVAAEVLENPLDRGWFLDTGDYPKLPAAAPAGLDVDGKHTLEALRPAQHPLPTSCSAAAWGEEEMKVTLDQKRLAIAILTLFGLFSLINDLVGWNVFGRYDKHVIIAVSFLLFFCIFFVGPSFEGTYGDRGSRSNLGTKRTLRLWKYLLPLMVVMFAVIFVGDGVGLLTGEPVPTDHWTGVAFIESLLVLVGIVGWHRLKRLDRRDGERD
jgi:hypothetical protein